MTYHRKANLILVLSCLVFILVAAFWRTYNGLLWFDWLFFVTQAAVIGSIADWFAVTALFEKPMGFPWHTELIYQHRERLIDSMTSMVATKLLKPSIWTGQLQEFSATAVISRWLISPEGQFQQDQLLQWLTKKGLLYMDDPFVQKQGVLQLRAFLRKKQCLVWLRNRGELLLNDDGSEFVTIILGKLEQYTSSVGARKRIEAAILAYSESAKLHSNINKSILANLADMVNLVDPKELAGDVQRQLVGLVHSWTGVGSEDRKWLCQQLREKLGLLDKLSPAQLQQWQDEMIDILPLESWVEDFLREGKEKLWFTKDSGGNLVIMDLLREQAVAAGQYYLAQKSLQEWVDGRIREVLVLILQNQHELIGIAVRRVLDGFDKNRFNGFLESKVGEDLSWIRINGALVGMAIGCIIFVFLHFIYTPYIVPLVRQWFM